jgi:hypothetical protein
MGAMARAISVLNSASYLPIIFMFMLWVVMGGTDSF